ncbi:glyoxylase-like metal-dependent hydrolase (beta-lactamase superfamily II) [Nitrosomonas oligotropha]|uniref:Glyoxylase-like metal-dependent hydrolase (Beta-lactamase superfamily II) n=1 Tax=Nitrosomonas oligotropha TaxID=42354 RepID=A0A2T5I093_9PROT|nr:MBL fold metallo-hydrolase [Nitrosomonas oligotropha]PTQ77252.1 glyoxylase-like metal-dependent hydrolase (beta-lactamase superfamily II) [Nitrosomonas oligotropha]
MKPTIQAFYDSSTWTISYVVFDESGGSCAIIDPVLDYDPKSGRTSTHSADKLIAFIGERRLSVEWILETHAHADHLSSADYLKHQVGGKTGIGDHIPAVQKTFKEIFNLGDEFVPDGHHFDHLFADGELFSVGNLTGKAISVSGHTPADLAYQFDDAVFVGDTLFMTDIGTARADFPGGDAHQLFHSIRKILALPSTTRLFMCHDYPPATRTAVWESTVAQQRAHNIHAHDGIDEDTYVSMRNRRDATLEMPNLLLPSIQVNIRAGKLPPVETNGVAYFKIPVNLI